MSALAAPKDHIYAHPGHSHHHRAASSSDSYARSNDSESGESASESGDSDSGSESDRNVRHHYLRTKSKLSHHLQSTGRRADNRVVYVLVGVVVLLLVAALIGAAVYYTHT